MRFFATIITIALCSLGNAGAADSRWAMDAGYDSNLNRGGDAAPEKGDAWLAADWTIRERRQHNTKLAWVYGAALRGEAWAEYSDLSRLDVSGRAGLRLKPGLGREVMSYGLDLDLGLAAFADSGRSNLWLAIEATLRRPLGIASEIYGGYRYLRTDADARVFDVERHALHAGWARSLTTSDAIRVELEARDGDIVSVTPADPAVNAVSRAFAPDDVFEPDWVAYRLEGTTQLIRLRWSRVLDGGTAIGAGVEAFKAQADDGPDYDGYRVRLQYWF